MKTLRAKAIEAIENMTEEYLTSIIVRSHDTNSHLWVEVLPDGTVKEAEEADNNSAHYISYPDKEVASVYDIHQESAEDCNCDVCVAYTHFGEMDKDEFIERYSEEEWEYINETDYEDAVIEQAHDSDIYEDDIRDEMLEAVESIPFGYFDDEEHKVEDVELTKGNGCDTLTWTLDGKPQSCTGEFFVDDDNILHHTAIAANGDEVEITLSYGKPSKPSWSSLSEDEKGLMMKQCEEAGYSRSASGLETAEELADNLLAGVQEDPDWFDFSVSDDEKADFREFATEYYKTISTMEELAEYINEADEWPADVEDIIEANGWVSDTGSEWGVCHDDNQKVVLNERGEAEVLDTGHYAICMAVGDRQTYVATPADIEQGGSVDPDENYWFNTREEAEKTVGELAEYCNTKGYKNVQLFIEGLDTEDNEAEVVSCELRPSKAMLATIARLEKKYGELEKDFFVEAIESNRVGGGFYDGCTLTDKRIQSLNIVVAHDGSYYKH